MATNEKTLRSHADVLTPRGERWRKQLASHLGRRCEVVHDGNATVLVLGGGSCAMTYDATTLRFAATAQDEEALAQVEQVVGVHFERFAVGEGLRVVWQRE